MRKPISEIARDDTAFALAMREFNQALRRAGYETAEDVIRLIREIKAEQAAEWDDEYIDEDQKEIWNVHCND